MSSNTDNRENKLVLWYNFRNGIFTEIGTYKAKGIKIFNPPGEKVDGNDWVLILDCI